MDKALGMKGLTDDILASYDERKEDVAAIKAEAKRVSDEAQDLLKEDKTERTAMAKELRQGLSDENKDRKGEVRQMLHNADELLKEFAQEREQTGKELRERLAQERSETRSEAEDILKNAQAMLKEFRNSLAEMSGELRKDLAQDKTERAEEIKALRAEFEKERASVREDLEEAQMLWANMEKAMAAKRAGEKPPKKSKSETAQTVETTQGESQTADLENKFIEILKANPNGISLAEIADRLGVIPIVLGRASKNLIEMGLVRKEDKLYFLGTGNDT